MFLVFPFSDGEDQREATSVYFGLNARYRLLCNQNINNNRIFNYFNYLLLSATH